MAHVIFNENCLAPSIMDEKILRNKKGVCGPEISFTGATPLKAKKQEFLSNVKNRNEFIKILSAKLVEVGCTVSTTTSDVNIFIAQQAARISDEQMTVVVGEDTTLLVLLCFYTKDENCGLFLRNWKKVKSTKCARLWNITETRNLIGGNKIGLLLFVHAFGGCQSTSHIFGIGEAVIFNKLDNNHFAGKILYPYFECDWGSSVRINDIIK